MICKLIKIALYILAFNLFGSEIDYSESELGLASLKSLEVGDSFSYAGPMAIFGLGFVSLGGVALAPVFST